MSANLGMPVIIHARVTGSPVIFRTDTGLIQADVLKAIYTSGLALAAPS
jgi:hypothetical protein